MRLTSVAHGVELDQGFFHCARPHIYMCTNDQRALTHANVTYTLQRDLHLGVCTVVFYAP